jgi:hypothetical protein
MKANIGNSDKSGRKKPEEYKSKFEKIKFYRKPSIKEDSILKSPQNVVENSPIKSPQLKNVLQSDLQTDTNVPKIDVQNPPVEQQISQKPPSRNMVTSRNRITH